MSQTLNKLPIAGTLSGAELIYGVQGTTDVAITTALITQLIQATGAVASFNGRTGSVVLTSNDVTGTLGYVPANVYSPQLLGTPTTTTPPALDNSAQIPTTGWVNSFLAGNASVIPPLVNGSAAAGASIKYAREDHIHPTDTSRLAVSAAAAIATSGSASDLVSGTVPTARLPVGNGSQLGILQVGTGLNVSAGQISVAYGSSAGMAAQGNDTRIVNALQTTSLGTGVLAALGNAIGTAGAPVAFNGAYGTPASINLANATGLLASQVGFTQTGTGAVATTIDAKFKQVVNVKDFGAVGDGTTDDGPAIQKAVNAGRQIEFPTEGNNVYLINTAVTIPANRALVCRGGDGVSNAAQILTSAAIHTFSPSGTNITIEGLAFTHSGSAGSCIRNVQNDAVSIQFNSFNATNTSNTDPVVYNSGSTNWVRFNRFSNGRTNAWTIDQDRTSGHFNIESHVELNYIAGVGNGIRVRSSDNSGRPEGVYIIGNSLFTSALNMLIEQVLQLTATSNNFDISSSYNVLLRPTNTGIEGVQFTGNWFATENQPTSGIAVFHDTSASTTATLSKIGFVNNTFQITGFAIVLYDAASNINSKREAGTVQGV